MKHGGFKRVKFVLPKRDAFVIADPFVDEIIGERELSQGTKADEK